MDLTHEQDITKEVILRSVKSIELLEEIRDLLKTMNAREMRNAKKRKQRQDNIGAQAGEYMGKIYDEMQKAAEALTKTKDWREPFTVVPENLKPEHQQVVKEVVEDWNDRYVKTKSVKDVDVWEDTDEQGKSEGNL